MTPEEVNQLELEITVLEKKLESATCMQDKFTLRDTILDIRTKINGPPARPDEIECIGCGS